MKSNGRVQTVLYEKNPPDCFRPDRTYKPSDILFQTELISAYIHYVFQDIESEIFLKIKIYFKTITISNEKIYPKDHICKVLQCCFSQHIFRPSA